MPRQPRLDALPHCVRNLRPTPSTTSWCAGLSGPLSSATTGTRPTSFCTVDGVEWLSPRSRVPILARIRRLAGFSSEGRWGRNRGLLQDFGHLHVAAQELIDDRREIGLAPPGDAPDEGEDFFIQVHGQVQLRVRAVELSPLPL